MSDFISGSSVVQLYRFEDPRVGPRKIPVLDRVLEGKVAIPEDAIFHIDSANNSVTLSENGHSGIELGSRLIYTVGS